MFYYDLKWFVLRCLLMLSVLSILNPIKEYFSLSLLIYYCSVCMRFILFHHVSSNANIKSLKFVIESKLICKFIFFTWLFNTLFILSRFDGQMPVPHTFGDTWFTLWLLLVQSWLWLAVSTSSNHDWIPWNLWWIG